MLKQTLLVLRVILCIVALLPAAPVTALEISNSPGNPESTVPVLELARSRGLILPLATIEQIEKDPNDSKTARLTMAARYSELTAILSTEKNRLQESYKDTDETRCRTILTESENLITRWFRYALFPAWAGGEWSMGGKPSMPQAGPIACGYFLERIMTDLGFNVRPAEGYTLGQLATDEMMWSYAGRHMANLKTWEGLAAHIAKKGPGLYLLGLSCSDYGHVLFLNHSSGETPLLFHAGLGPTGVRVQADSAEKYVTQFMRPHIIHAAKINRGMIKKWLTGNPIRPVKCKSYLSAAEREAGLVLAAQKSLRGMGYYAKLLDGIYGPSTRKALGLFQKSRGLTLSYLPDADTMKQLRSSQQQP